VLLTLFIFLPFVNKAVSSDAVFYIYTARQIINNPVQPFDFTINTAGENRRAWDVG